MSSSQDFAELGRFYGRRNSVRVPEMKSNFSQTCSLLSQYLKEKGSFGDLNFEITRNPDGKGKVLDSLSYQTMMKKMKLSTNTEITADVSDRDEAVTSPKVKSIDLFPQRAGFGPSEDVPNNKTDTRDETNKQIESKSETAPLTIFYAGQVFVFENVPAEKAKELMLFASKGLGSADLNGSFVSATSTTTITTSSDDKKKLNFGGLAGLSSNVIASDSANNSKARSLRQANASDLPIARRASLHRFLEKRKDRVSERTPYQLNSNSAATAPAPLKAEESKSWLGLAS